MRKKVVGLTGIAGSGKDTLAIAMSQRSQLPLRPYSMTTPINRMIDALLGHPVSSNTLDQPHHWADQSYKASTVLLETTVRRLQQTLGTEWGRDLIHPDIWLWAAEQAINRLPTGHVMVITNIRFVNEAEWVRARGGKIIRVDRSFAQGGMTADEKIHVSEAGIPEALVDATLLNNGTVNDLGAAGAALLRELGYQ